MWGQRGEDRRWLWINNEISFCCQYERHQVPAVKCVCACLSGRVSYWGIQRSMKTCRLEEAVNRERKETAVTVRRYWSFASFFQGPILADHAAQWETLTAERFRSWCIRMVGFYFQCFDNVNRQAVIPTASLVDCRSEVSSTMLTVCHVSQSIKTISSEGQSDCCWDGTQSLCLPPVNTLFCVRHSFYWY